MDDLTLTPRTDDNGEAVDDEIDTEMEVQMRKMRYEQQKFLEEKEVHTLYVIILSLYKQTFYRACPIFTEKLRYRD